jgi:hypothetical protein
MSEILAGMTQLSGAVALTYCASVLITIIVLCVAGAERRRDLLEALRILCRRRFPDSQESVDDGSLEISARQNSRVDHRA